MFMNSMFDFRHGGSIHKLLMDKKRGSKRIVLRLWWRSSLPVTATLSEAEMQCVKNLTEEEETQQKCDTKCRGKTRRRREEEHAAKPTVRMLMIMQTRNQRIIRGMLTQ
ncbi:uncharacterized protein LOC108821206 isoform X2 [Raphanus sativus]|uniref:Uncharacterized protein LOC108821206 isoform X2 n=1 Tax=Raphanus sativus TaxID=3726 RepID=A0A6J0KP76_RAPSA|nr:uncharacterized protein LOC108821206 isoform X2 [Raphanus sativus]